MLHGKVLRSRDRRTAGSVRSTRRRAEAMPGVRLRPRGADLADLDPFYGHAIQDRPIIAIDRVRFAGEPVAVVAAEDRGDRPRRRSRSIDVDYEELPAVTTVEEALAPVRAGASRGPGAMPASSTASATLPEREGNVCYRYEIDRGEIEAAFAHADVVVEGDYTFPAVYQYALETHTVVAQVGRRRDHGLGLVPTPVPRPRRARRPLRRARCRVCA